MDNLILLLSTVYALCNCSQDFNITFHANRITWNEAVKYCVDNGGLLYSDENDIRNRIYGEDEVWTGKYRALTAWTIEWGCFRINFGGSSKEIFSVNNTEQPECQQKCTSTDFFAIKGDICKCIHSAELNDQIKGSPCTCTSCVTVLRHRIDNVKTRSETGCAPNNADCTCMAAACIQTKLILTPELCNHNYNIMCDNNNTTLNENQGAARDFCYEQNSFLRRYTEGTCNFGSGQHWTSGRRSIYHFIVQHTDEESTINPLQCFRVKKLNDEGTEYEDCDKALPYFCKIGGNIHEDDTILYNESKGKSVAGAIGGTISAIIVIIAIVSVTAIFFFKRRKISKQPQMRQILNKDRPNKVNSYTKENNSDGQYHDIDIETVDYSLAKPFESNQKPTNQTEGDTNEYTKIVSSSFPIQNEASKTNNTISNPGYNDMNPKDRHSRGNNVSNKRANHEAGKMADYELATPISDTEELDQYTANTDYDHLNNIKKPEMSDVKVYDHLNNLNNATETDPTYDHSGVTVREDTENYEHFNIEQ